MGGDQAPLSEHREQAEDLQGRITDLLDALELLKKKEKELEGVLREADVLRASLDFRMEGIREMRAGGWTITPDGRAH